MSFWSPDRVENTRARTLSVWLATALAEQLGVPVASIDRGKPFAEYGLSSSETLVLLGDLEERVGRELPDTIFWDHPTVAALADALADEPAETPSADRPSAPSSDPIAVVGMACRFPGAASADDFWRLLSDGRDAVREVPPDRWHSDLWHGSGGGSIATRRAGCLDRVDGFDAAFFGIAPREAEQMDPQQRLVLEVVWEALESAGVPAERLAGSRTGVFVGISSNDYARLGAGRPEELTAWTATGNALSIAANRVSYVFDLRGPSVAIDTACSSSLVAVHLACASLRAGECDLAIVAGVNLLLSPDWSVVFSQAHMLSPDGVCRTFDAGANGYVRGEGCGAIVLQREGSARAAGRRVLARVRGSALNQDGRSNGLTAPNSASQTAVVRAALADARLTPADVDAVEAHGTATPLGDPIEVAALREVFADAGRGPVLLGSVKTNIGHLEAAAGVAGVIKAVLALRHGAVPPHLHCRELNPRIGTPSPFDIPRALVTWEPLDRPRRYGVSSFGFGGTNAHVLLEAADPIHGSPSPASGAAPVLVLVSAATAAALAARCRQLAEFLDGEVDLGDLAWTLASRRSHLRCRAAFVASSVAELRAQLREAGAGERAPSPAGDDALAQLGRRWVAGEAIDGEALSAGPRRLVDLPAYPWQRERYWLPVSPAREHAWDSAVAAARRRERWVPHDLSTDAIAAGMRALDRLALEGMADALLRLDAFPRPGARRTPAAIAEDAGIADTYRHLLSRWLDALVRDGRLRREADGGVIAPSALIADVAGAEQRARAALPDAGVLVDYVMRCIDTMPRVLRGAASPLETLFPDSSYDTVEFLYHAWSVPRYFNGLAAEFLAEWHGARPPRDVLRVIEVGAGTGGLTRAVLPLLPAARTRYRFTDLSEFFFQRIRERLAAYPFVEYGLLDLEKDPADQGHGAGGFDVVLAANVLHATRDLGRTLDHAAALLAPGGLLLVYEVTTPFVWLDVSVALIEGWQRFEDGLRTDTPLIGGEQWRAALLGHGFEAVEAFPGDGPLAVLGQHVIAARRSSDASGLVVEPAVRAVTAPDWVHTTVWTPVSAGASASHDLALILVTEADRPRVESAAASLAGARVMAVAGDDIEATLREAARLSGATRLRLVDLRPALRTPAVFESPAQLTAAAAAACAEASALCRACASLDAPVALTFVTRGAQAAGDDGPDPIQATVGAVAAVASHELSGIAVRHVDCDPADDPVPYLERVFDLLAIDESALAIRGDEVLAPRLRRTATPLADLPVAGDATYVVTGGFGVLGARVARRLAERGARHLVLLGRTAPQSGSDAPSLPPDVRVLHAIGDVADPACWARLLEDLRDGAWPPIRGCVHTAGDQSLSPILSSGDEPPIASFSAKAGGTLAADRALEDQPLDFFVVFSSASAALAPADQANYAAANRCAEALVAARRARGRAGSIIAWGVWDDAGASSRAVVRHFAQEGLPQIGEAEGLALFERLAGAPGTHVVLPGEARDWRRFVPAQSGDHLLADLMPRPTTAAIGGDRVAIEAATLQDDVVAEVARVLGLDISAVDPHQPPAALGLDSLMGLDLCNRFQARFGVKISMAEVLGAPAVLALVDLVATRGRVEASADWETTTL